MSPNTRVLYCDCAYAGVLPEQVKQEVREALTESGASCDIVGDLCELAARKDPLLAELAGEARLAIAACHPRAVKWLFAAAGVPLRDEGVAYLDMREAPAEQLVEAIRDLTPGGGAAVRCETAALPGWKPWFPVIDYSRCQNCQQCLGFCLFSVYGAGPDGKVQVQNPASCKTGCPACARVCPDAAIIFPKYANAPINGGNVKEGDPVAEPVKLDKAALVRGDVLTILRERGKNGGPRFSADPARVKAMQERLVHLGGLTSKPPANTEPA